MSGVLALGVGYLLTPRYPTEAHVIEAPIVEVVPQALQGETVALELQVAEAQSGCMYYSAFDVAPVEVEAGQQMKVLHRAFSFMDGCDWESEERLERQADGRYRYTYTEHAVSCPPDRNAAASCTRTGYAVAREDEDDHEDVEESAAEEQPIGCKG